MLRLGDVVWKPPKSRLEVRHWHVVSSRPCINPASVVLLPITSWDDWKDDSCLISSDEYSELRHDSCVDYRFAKIVHVQTLLDGCESGTIQKCPTVSDDLMQKILKGATETRELSQACLNILTVQDLLPD